MGPEKPLPLPDGYIDAEPYVNDLLEFVTSSNTLQLLVGGVHILDFFTRSPDLYEWLLDEEWREWFEWHELEDILDFILREDLDLLVQSPNGSLEWRGKPVPPRSLVIFVKRIRDLSLRRDHPLAKTNDANKESWPSTITRTVAVGMKPKKIHEVDNFARFIQKLTADLAESENLKITHFVDFGSGQNYLGRTLASQPYNNHVIAVESKPHNVESAKAMDVHAKLVPKPGVRVNKKLLNGVSQAEGTNSSVDEQHDSSTASSLNGNLKETQNVVEPIGPTARAKLQNGAVGLGSVQYVQHRLQDGDLSAVIDEIVDKEQSNSNYSAKSSAPPNPAEAYGDSNAQPAREKSVRSADPRLMVISLHSCGNLLHHGLRSLTLNDSVRAVAMVGCCYNLATERLTPPSYKLPNMRPDSQLFAERGTNCIYGDPHGYPMSSRLCDYQSRLGKGVHWNITSRMMAVQAPQNWGPEDSNDFFTRHFFRALLQKVFLDRGVVDPPSNPDDAVADNYAGRSPAGAGGGSTQPIIIGSLRKSCYENFTTYVRGALEKLSKDPNRAPLFQEKMGDISDAEIRAYADSYKPRKKHLSVVWTLMAHCAALVEAVMVVDRWLWLREQGEVGHCWVETVFDYTKSPRNLAVVGIKRN